MSSPESNNIYQAVHESNHELLKTLLVDAKLCDINDKNLEFSALDLAVRNGDYTATKLLLDHGALPNYNRQLNDKGPWQWPKSGKNFIDPESLLYEDNSEYLDTFQNISMNNTFFYAAQGGNRDVIKLLVEQCSIAIPHYLWYNVVKRNYLSIFKIFVECTGQEFGDNQWSKEMMFIACSTGSTNIVLYLINEGVPVNIQFHGLTGAFNALICKDPNTFMILATRRANLHFADSNGLSLLHVAVSRNLLSTVNFLLDSGVDVNIRDRYNRTPLHYLYMNSDIDVLKLLVNRGADINAVDSFGQTPVMKSRVFYFNKKILHYLLQQENIDLVKQDNQGRTILHHFVQKNNFLPEFCVKKNILFRPEIDINARDKNNLTPLHYTVINSYSTFFHVLLEFGADTRALIECKNNLVSNEVIIIKLALFRIKRKIAGFDDDENIDTILNEQKIVDLKTIDIEYDAFQKQIESMKETLLFGRYNYFDFLHAKKRACMTIAKKPELRERFFSKSLEFPDYAYMLAKSYVNGLKPFNKVESKAINFVEDNLAIISNYILPSTITYEIKKYIDIEDMVTLQEMNSLELSEQDNVK